MCVVGGNKGTDREKKQPAKIEKPLEGWCGGLYNARHKNYRDIFRAPVFIIKLLIHAVTVVFTLGSNYCIEKKGCADGLSLLITSQRLLQESLPWERLLHRGSKALAADLPQSKKPADFHPAFSVAGLIKI